MDASGNNSGLNPDEWLNILKWLLGGIAFLAYGWMNRLSGRTDKNDARLDNHAQRLTALDGKTERD